MMENLPDTIPADKFVADAPKQSSPDVIPADQFQSDEDKYGGIGQQAVAGVEGAARGATLGLSDLAETRLGISTPEAIQQRQEQNPWTAGLANLAGTAGIIGLTGGLAAPLEAGLGGSLAARAVGYGAEGALLGAGNAVSEAALGDPSLNAEKIAAHIGTGAMLGSTLGALSKAFDAAPALFRKSSSSPATESAISESSARSALQEQGFLTGPAAAEAEGLHPDGSPLRDAIDLKNLPKEDQEGIIQGLQKIKPNAKEIAAAADDIGAPLPEGLISDSPHIQRIEDMLLGDPTPTGIARKQLYQKGYDAAVSATSDAVGGLDEVSARQAGDSLKSIITDWFEQKAGPVKQLYNQIEEYAPAVPISDKSTGSISRNIRKIIGEEGLIKGTPEHGFVNTFADGLEEVQNLQQMKNFRTALGRATSPETNYVSGLIKEKLDNLEQNAIKRFSETMKTPEAKQKITDLLSQVTDAKRGYAALREDMAQVGKNVLGRKKIYGPQDFINSIEEQTPEKFAKKLFAKDNSQFIQWLSKESPDAMRVLSNFQKSSLRDAATKDGKLIPQSLFKNLDKLSPEIKSALFTPQELSKINSARTYLEAFPKDYNPSHTSSMSAYRNFFEHPVSAITQSAKDWAALGLVKRAVNPEQFEAMSKLKSIQSSVRSFDGKISSGIKTIFRSSVPVVSGEAVKAMSDSDYKEKTKRILNLSRNPSSMADHMSDQTQSLSNIAPGITHGINSSMIRAVQFLSSKIPQPASHMFLSHDYEPTEAQKRDFSVYYNAVNDPLLSLEQVKSGTLNSQTLDALNAVHPALYQEMKQKMMEHMDSEKVRDMPYSVKMSVAKFLGQPLDENMIPQVVLSNQEVLNAPSLSTQSAPKQGRKTALGPMKNIQVAGRLRTQTQKDDEEGL